MAARVLKEFPDGEPAAIRRCFLLLNGRSPDAFNEHR
jgi:hypothetical protein